MKIVEIDVDKLKAYEKNPRKNDKAVNAVAESIRQFGFKVPIVIDTDNVIVAGHTRVKAANMLKLKKVPCIVADDLTDEQIKAFRLADNKVAELAGWDFDLLIDEIEGVDGVDMTAFGFEAVNYDGEDYDLSLNLDEEPSPKNKQVKTCRCPKCEFEFEV